ncbi:hypothetical protein [Emticicia sp. SJ17W-69]|uniref:hypothetical protein n=1 Tax=Emticicia sp. SJ17W-69 TaxID=3421657 RepID=UPI003EB7D91E
MKKIALKSALFVIEWILILVFHIYLRDHALSKFVKVTSGSIDVMSSLLYIVYISPFFLLIRLLFQKINNINKPVFILQNVYMFTVFLLSSINDGDSLMKLYLFGAILNLIFYYVDGFCVKMIDSMAE